MSVQVCRGSIWYLNIRPNDEKVTYIYVSGDPGANCSNHLLNIALSLFQLSILTRCEPALPNDLRQINVKLTEDAMRMSTQSGETWKISQHSMSYNQTC